MNDTSAGLVFLAVIVSAVLLTLVLTLLAAEYFRRRTWSRQFWTEAQPSATLALRTGHRVHQSLIRSCARESVPLPTITLIALDDQRAQVSLAVPSERAPHPWAATADGVTWTAPLDAVDEVLISTEGGAEVGPAAIHSSAGAPDAPAGKGNELFVTAGRTARATVFLNLAAAPGPISLRGPLRLRRQMLRRWIAELTEPHWRLDVNALVVGDPQLLSGRATDASSSLRADAAQDFPGGLLVIGSQNEAERLAAVHQRATADRLTKTAVVIDGESSRAAWRLTAADNGTLRSSVFPEFDWRDTPELALKESA